MSAKNAKLFVVAGPSGIGLREIVGRVIESRDDIGSVLPVTARKMKPGERDGVGFYFYDLEGWTALKEAGDLLETTELAGNDYGTSRRLVQQQLEQGKNVVLSLELDRAAQIKASMPEAVCVYMAPASEAQLRARIEAISRSAVEVSVRLEQALQQRQAADFCDVVIDSGDAEAAVQAFNALIDRCSA